MARIPVHSTREQWLATAVEALRPCLREHAGLSVPRVRLSCGVHSRRQRGEVYRQSRLRIGVSERAARCSRSETPNA